MGHNDLQQRGHTCPMKVITPHPFRPVTLCLDAGYSAGHGGEICKKWLSAGHCSSVQ